MRQYLRFVTVVLMSLLSLSQMATVVCEATCGPRQATRGATHTSEPACHSTTAPASDAPWISGIDYAACDHDLPSDVVVTAQRDNFQVRQAALESGGSAWARGSDPQNSSHLYPDVRPDIRVPALIEPPLRI